MLAVGKGGSGEKESSALLEAAHSRASLTETSDVDQETTPTTKRHTSVFETVEEASASSGEACAGKKQSAAGSPALRSASIASVTSDLTVSEECDDTETVVGEGERREPRSRSSTFQRDNTASPEQGQSHSHTYQTSVSFRRELLGMIRLDTESRVGVEIGRVSVPGADPVQLLARSLPHIYPHVHLSKREVSHACSPHMHTYVQTYTCRSLFHCCCVWLQSIQKAELETNSSTFSSTSSKDQTRNKGLPVASFDVNS